MAKKSQSGKSLVIVESPAKARTIGNYLGKGFTVEASIGHIRDLPQGAKEVPEEFKKENWAYLGVNVDDEFHTRLHRSAQQKAASLQAARTALKDAKDLYLATDEDREGEAISWHLCEVLKPKVPVQRLVFHEITEEAIQEALANPRDIDEAWFGPRKPAASSTGCTATTFRQLLWKKVGRGLSAGRVQSVAVRLIVERERQRMAFRSATYWDLIGTFATAAQEQFQADLVSVDGRQVFPPAKTSTRRRASSRTLAAAAGRGSAYEPWPSGCGPRQFRVTSHREQALHPQAGSRRSRRARCNRKRTASWASRLAARCLRRKACTRTATSLTCVPIRPIWPQVAIDAARDLVAFRIWTASICRTSPRAYASKVKNAQEAHEAIRPAGHPFELPEVLRGQLNSDEFRLFELIWKRTIASQMADARGQIDDSHDRGWRSDLPCQRQDDRFSWLPAGVCGRFRQSRSRPGRSGDSAAGGGRPAKASTCRELSRRPHDAATRSFHRSVFDSRIGRQGDRPAQHLRLDHRDDSGAGLRLQEGERAGPDVDGIRGDAAARRAFAVARRLPVHRRDGRLSRRHQPPRATSTSST